VQNVLFHPTLVVFGGHGVASNAPLVFT